MGKRYYCDYCDRHFVDDLGARKKHLSGVLHSRLVSEHYSLLKDAKTAYAEEIAKIPCKRFKRFKECVFGSNCKFSHYSREQLEYLKYQAEEEDNQVHQKAISSFKFDRNAVELLLQKAFQEKAVLGKTDLNTGRPIFTIQYPPSFRDKWGLPPSLQPMKLEDFTFSDFEDWCSYSNV